MKTTRALLAAALIGIGSLTGTAAQADYGYHHGGPRQHYNGGGWGWAPGLVLGSALLWAATRPPAVVYQEPVVMMAPPNYAAPPSDGWWYYCAPVNAYYPYAQSCPVPWQRVPPR
jgi:hypothetical protein